MSARFVRLLSLVVLIAAASGCASHSVDGASSENAIPDVFPAIPDVRASGGIAKLRLDALLDPRTGAPQFAYQGTIGLAPTIRVSPGDTIDLTLGNGLPFRQNEINGVNIHFHGLTVSPNAPADDSIMTLARIGQIIHYVVKIPRDQQPGLYWYHPHSHGESYREVTAGMSGAIVVEGLERHLPALATMKERIIVLRDVATRAGYVDEDLPMEQAANGSTVVRARAADNGNPCRPEAGLQPTLNGMTRPSIGIESGEREFFRVVNASAARHFDLSIDGSRLELVALDGVALDAYPGSRAVERVSHIVLPPAGRAEFVVTGLDHPTVLRSACFDSGSAGDANPAVVLADLVDPRTLHGSPEPGARATPGDIVAALPNARPVPRVPAPVAAHTIRFTEDVNGFYLNGKIFDMDAPPAITSHVGTTEAWTIRNDTSEVHDFHIHQIHFAAEQIDGRPVRERHWRDTIVVHPHGSVRLLMDFRSPVIRGTFLYHCHILDHEDQGMMAKIRVI